MALTAVVTGASGYLAGEVRPHMLKRHMSQAFLASRIFTFLEAPMRLVSSLMTYLPGFLLASCSQSACTCTRRSAAQTGIRQPPATDT